MMPGIKTEYDYDEDWMGLSQVKTEPTSPGMNLHRPQERQLMRPWLWDRLENQDVPGIYKRNRFYLKKKLWILIFFFVSNLEILKQGKYDIVLNADICQFQGCFGLTKRSYSSEYPGNTVHDKDGNKVKTPSSSRCGLNTLVCMASDFGCNINNIVYILSSEFFIVLIKLIFQLLQESSEEATRGVSEIPRRGKLLSAVP